MPRRPDDHGQTLTPAEVIDKIVKWGRLAPCTEKYKTLTRNIDTVLLARPDYGDLQAMAEQVENEIWGELP